MPPRCILKGNQQGFSLIEVLVSLALLGTIVAGILGALASSSVATHIDDERTTAQALAQSQIEYVWDQSYDSVRDPPQYEVLTDLPQGYTITCTASRLDPEGDGLGDDDGLQKITVTVSHAGKSVITLEAYKVRR